MPKLSNDINSQTMLLIQKVKKGITRKGYLKIKVERNWVTALSFSREGI